MRQILLLSLLIQNLVFLFPAHSEPEDTVKIEDVAEPRNSVPGDLDQEITSPKLRADSGSRRGESMSTTMSYTGGSLSNAFGAGRPDLRGLPENQTNSSVDGAIKARYRSNKNVSYTGGVSLGFQTPFQGNVNGRSSQLTVGDPILGRNYTFAAGGLQHSWDLTGSYGTSFESLRVDQVASIATDYTLMKVFNNGFHVSVTATAWNNFFSSHPGANAYTALPNGGNYDDTRTAWEVTFFPTVEYYFTDHFSVRTLFGDFSWRHLYGSANNFSMSNLKAYQSLGLGISVTRDVYLYPNVQFLPQDMQANFTNVGISSSINVF